jgi:hypothetical protein
MLPCGDSRDRSIPSVAFLSHIESKATGPRPLPFFVSQRYFGGSELA